MTQKKNGVNLKGFKKQHLPSNSLQDTAMITPIMLQLNSRTIFNLLVKNLRCAMVLHYVCKEHLLVLISVENHDISQGAEADRLVRSICGKKYEPSKQGAFPLQLHICKMT